MSDAAKPPSSAATAQCTAHNRRGERCERLSVEGSVVCRYHGGGVPMARAAAKKRLLSLVPDALDALHEAMQRADWPQVVRAAFGIMDRAGMGPTQTINVETDADTLRKLTDEELEARVLQVAALLKDRKTQGARATNDDDAGHQSSVDIVH